MSRSWKERGKVWRHWWPLIVYVLLILIGLGIEFSLDDKNGVHKFWAAIDTSSAVALAVIAGIAYYQYSREKSKQQIFLNDLEKSKSTTGTDGAVLISFGGKKNVLNDMRNYAKNELKIPDNLIVEKRFGDENGTVHKEDLQVLEDFLEKEVMVRLTYVDRVHLFYGVVGVGAYVCADILNNWKETYVYHFDNDYELWYIDRKHRKRNNADLHQADIQH